MEETEFVKGIKHGLMLVSDAYCKGKLPTEEQLAVVEGKVKEMLHIPHPRTIALVAILEWEKIRNSPN